MVKVDELVGVVDDDEQQGQEEDLVLVDWLAELAVCARDSETDADDDVLEDAQKVEGSVSCTWNSL